MKRKARQPMKPTVSPPRKMPPLTTAEFWAGDEGRAYTARNRVDWAARVPFWQHIIEVTNAASFCEVGTNAGWNFQAIRSLNAEAIMSGVDLNEAALLEAQTAGFDVEVAQGYHVAEIFGAGACELSFTSGVLIHVPTADLMSTMAALRDVSSQYVLAVEYDAPEEQEVDYRGHTGKLWRRPFGKLYEGLGLSLVESGVAGGFDQCHYWLLER